MNIKLALLTWVLMVLFAIGNGVFAEFVLAKALGAYPVHLYKTVLAIAVIFIASRLYLERAYPDGATVNAAIYTGLLWSASSIVFEFGFGHFIVGLPMEKIVAEYRISEGRLWSLVIVSELIFPTLNFFISFRD
ncbi:MAG: hypothetical protein A2X93_00155 [Deltaproteobacteria bacterium GWC2_56_8]|nr:MAG: hypothetical protein A2X99_02370 [Deltaproteobacteria bacterium GWB2_55_19]OGP33460.1 MAG: hypothetical protein A2X93_00155 [Deltaproteobacteria bacterium GWC2_56_8]